MIRLRGERESPSCRDKCHSRYALYTLLHIPLFRVYAKERKKSDNNAHAFYIWGTGGGNRRTHSLSPRVSFPTSRAKKKEERRIGKRPHPKWATHVPLFSCVSLPRIDAQAGTHHRLPKKDGRKYGDTSSPLLPGKRCGEMSLQTFLVSFRRRQTINRQPRFALCSRQFLPPPGKQSRKKSLHFSPLFKLPSLIPSPFSKSKQKQESHLGENEKKLLLSSPRPSSPRLSWNAYLGKEFDNYKKTFLQLISFALWKKYWFNQTIIIIIRQIPYFPCQL